LTEFLYIIKTKIVPTNSFRYFQKNITYFDHSCQSLRPKSVINAILKYYVEVNTCSGRGSHSLSNALDKEIEFLRQTILQFLGKDSQYTVVFTTNTTVGINSLLTNLDWERYENIVTTNKEHNSVFLPALSFSKQFNKNFICLNRDEMGQINLEDIRNLSKSVIIFNTTSNIDGVSVENLPILSQQLKARDNLILLDATQSLAHSNLDFSNSDFDCLFASSHKLYGPSLGFMVIKKNLLKNLKQFWVGGGTVKKVSGESFEFIDQESDLPSKFEFGLQDYAGMYGLLEALKWLQDFKIKNEYSKINYKRNPFEQIQENILHTGPSKEALYYIENLAELLFVEMQNLAKLGKIKLLNQKASSIISFVPKNMDSYQLAETLDKKGFVFRSGFLCNHYYIKEVQKLPAVSRFSLGLHNTPKDIYLLISLLHEKL
jgi:selenocysteine lyase/cysteine desulfurase